MIDFKIPTNKDKKRPILIFLDKSEDGEIFLKIQGINVLTVSCGNGSLFRCPLSVDQVQILAKCGIGCNVGGIYNVNFK